MNSTLTIAKLTFREASRRKILLAGLLLALAFLLVFGLGFHFVMLEFEKEFGQNDPLELPQVTNVLMMAGIYVVNFLTVMMTVLISVDTISGEILSGAIHTLVSKPVRRWEIVAGKWLGFASMLTLYLLLTAGGVMSIVFLRGGYVAPNPLGALALLWLNASTLAFGFAARRHIPFHPGKRRAGLWAVRRGIYRWLDRANRQFLARPGSRQHGDQHRHHHQPAHTQRGIMEARRPRNRVPVG